MQLCARLAAALLVLLCTQTRATAPSSAANDPLAGLATSFLAGGRRGGPYDLNDPAQLSAAISRYAPEGQLILYAYGAMNASACYPHPALWAAVSSLPVRQ